MLRLALLGWLAASLAYPVIIDQIAITVNSDLIKDSDINRDLLATQMLNGEPPNLSLAARKKDASHLIDQIFIREEIREGAYPAATTEEADRQLDELIKERFKSQAALDAALKSYQLTKANLREQFRWQLTVLRFIDARFRPAVLITDQQVNRYYSLHEAQLRKQNPKGSEADLKSDARDTLTAEAVNKQLFDWLDQRRRDAKVRYLEGGFRMTRSTKLIWLKVSAGIVGALVLLVFVALLVTQSPWFQNYVRAKIIATIEDSTGGRAEIGSFRFDPWDLKVKISDFTLHGTEAPGTDPLAHIASLELRLKLFAGLKKTVDLAYLGINQPRVNLIVNQDGTTNVPSPKIKKAPSQTSGLETVVDLAVGQFRIDNGLLLYSRKASSFSAKGNDLQVLLNFNDFNSSYEGHLLVDPLELATGTKYPLRVQVNLPVLLEKDAVSISGGRLATDFSQVLINAGLRNLNSPKITARVNANVSIAEIQKSFDLPLAKANGEAPQNLTAELAGNYDDTNSSLQIQTAHLALGQTNFEAAGTLVPGGNQFVQFNGKLALAGLSELLPLGDTKLAGLLQLHGHATLDARREYAVDGTLDTLGLAVRSGTTSLPGLQLNSPFHLDPYLISMDGLKLSALDGAATAKIFVEKLQDLSLEARLDNFSIPVLARQFAGRALPYDGFISGFVKAKSNLKAKGTNGLRAATQLTIAPGTRGMPLSGRIAGRFDGTSDRIQLEQSYISLPHSRLDLSGDINKQLNASLVSHNLADFKPVFSSFPLTLEAGGDAHADATIQGNLSAPQITAHATIDRFAVQGTSFQQVALDLAASQSGVAVRNGVLKGPDLNANFDASLALHKWEPHAQAPLNANVTINGQAASILALAGQQDLAVAGQLNLEAHVNGTYGDPLGNANLQVVNGIVEGQPFEKVQGHIDLAHELITLRGFEVDAAGGQLIANGIFRHPSDSFQVGHAEFHVNSSNIQLTDVQALQKQSPGIAGVLKLVADGSGDLRKASTGTEFQITNVSTDFSARSLKVNQQAAGELTAQARTANGAVDYRVSSNFAGSSIQVDGTTSLAKGYFTKASASVENLRVEQVLAMAGEGGLPVRGLFSANGSVSGTLARPEATVKMTLSKAVVYSEPLNDLTTQLHYTSTLIDIPTLNLNVPAGSLSASARYAHKDGDFHSGDVQVRLNSSDIDLSKIKQLAQLEPGVAGSLKLNVSIAGNVQDKAGQPPLLLTDANAEIAATSLQANGRALGQLQLTAKTQQHAVKYDLNANVAQSNLTASGTTELAGDYITHAKATFGKLRWANIAPYIPSESATKPAFDARLDGEASVDGPVLNLDALTGRLQLNQLVFEKSAQNATEPTGRLVHFENDTPVVVTLDHSVITVDRLKVQDGKTYLQASGALSLKDQPNGLALRVQGNADLSTLQNADRDFYSSGTTVLDATIHGSLAKPLVNGRVELKNANVNYINASNGLSDGNGVILLNGTNATIQNLTGESGGGKIAITGFAGFTPTGIVFNLRASANRVRTRYADASVTSSAEISLAGSNRRSTLSGTVTVHRVAYSSSSDVGSLLSGASVPPSSPAAPSLLLSGMHLDVRIVTATDLRVVSTYTDKLSLTSNLTLTGTAQDPGMVGRLSITNGQLVFFGNTYTVNTGSINFYNTNTIEPILNLSLETLTQGVDVTLGVTGPISDLKLSYRSDPPLTFQQIVQLLATNTTPSDPTIAAHQPTPPQESTSQMGESAVLGQAVANPLASRVQRVFGLTQFKIDPSISGGNGQPGARVTLQQKISSNLTFSYITDVTQSNSEIIRATLDLTPTISAVALRDYNGDVSVELFYKFQKR